MNKETIPTWELLQKRITYKQLGQIKNKRILDLGVEMVLWLRI